MLVDKGEQAITQQQHRPILIVDDDPSILATVADVLNFEGYLSVTAANGLEALTELEKTQPCLVLLDMRMPMMTGWEFADEVRKRGISVPIVVMTAAQDAPQWSNEIHAQGVLPKPFDVSDLMAAVEALC